MNDIFDIMNGRNCAQAINLRNWHEKKKKLDNLLWILDETERIHKEKNPDLPSQMFLSDVTLEGWRISVKSVIMLTEEMFNAGYNEVLSGKFNQDLVEVSFNPIKISQK